MTELYLVSYDPAGIVPGVARHINPQAALPGQGLVIGNQILATPQQWLFATFEEARRRAEQLCIDTKITYIVAKITELGRFEPIKPQWSGASS